ncbi:MAG TPA: response regulator transcription factor [Actinomycetota bacterium]|nr:response regulator transcription factor [Actinomycetota bacterium]
MISVLVVDDQALIRSGFRMIIDAEDDMKVVGEAPNGQEAISAASALSPDVVLMDIRMPVMDGVEATRTLTQQGNCRVLILTTFDLDEYVFAAVRAGASGFLLKDVPPDDLIDAVRVVARGDALIEPRMTRRLLAEFIRQTPASSPPDPKRLEALTSREVEVLELVAQGLANSEIAEALFISETTVKTHVAHIFTKLDLRDRVQAVVFAYESGLVTPSAG